MKMAASAVCHRNPEQLANGESDEGVLAHVGCDSEWPVGVKRHEVAAERGGQHSGDERWAFRNSRRRENRRIHYHDVRHGGKGGEPGDQLARERGLVTLEIEQLRQPVQVCSSKCFESDSRS